MKIIRMGRSALGASVIVAFSLAAPAHASDALRAAIEAANEQLLAAVARGDAAGAAAAFTADAQVMAPNSDPIKGKDSIQMFVQRLIDTGVAGAVDNILEVYGCGPYAIEIGEGMRKDKSGKVIYRGKYIVIWKREGGKLKIFRDMFSSNSPTPE